MTIHRGGAALFGVAAALGAGQAAAQDEPIKLDAIGVEAAAAQKLLGNADITEEEMEARNPTSLKDVFKAESGVQVTGGAAIAQKVVVQGIEETLLSVTIDGARQNKSAFHHTGNILIDPALLKRVEISAGLAPADAGPGAVAGAIAYETKDARDLLEDGETWGGIASVSAFSNGPEMRAGLTLFGQAATVRKVSEEATEVVMAAKDDDYAERSGTERPREELAGELADLFYHSLVLCAERGLSPSAVIDTLKGRHKT